MNFPVVKGASYCLIQTPMMTIYQGTTQTSERRSDPNAAHLQALPKYLRSFEECVQYAPNQVYIGNLRPAELEDVQQPWFENPILDARRDGRFGGIYSEDELIGMIKLVDAFDLVLLEASFQEMIKAKLSSHPLLGDLKDIEKISKNPPEQSEIERLVTNHLAEPMYFENNLVGCVKKAHEFDAALTEHVMFENLVSKASSVMVFKELLAKTCLKVEDVDYIIECSEEACGDMNQRGGGNFAKAIGETVGCINATGSDTRSFCAAPAHALVEAAALTAAGVYKNVIVVAGGASAKLGMNSKSHIEKNMPVIEDVLGAFAVHISQNDGVSPIIRTDAVGGHKIGSGSSPQAVMTAIVTDPLDRVGIKLAEIDKFSPEMQNPEITKPAGAGDVPEANYKMIAALGVKRGDFNKADLAQEVKRFGMPGYAPTQGHIPSGVPFMGFAKEMIEAGELNKVMIIGKGSLFLGRMTNLFDGVSFIMEKNPGLVEENSFDKDAVKSMIAEAMRNFAATL